MDRIRHRQGLSRHPVGAMLLVGLLLLAAGTAWAQAGVEFPGTVLLVDPAAGKLAVKKDGGGTRFTFVVNEKTQFEGTIKSLKDVKKDDKVTVLYAVTGSQYLAQKVTKGK
ncbi:MAG: hypothetical protein EPO61_01675 [Nitrospirae bacterium]|nr:MAG: hypothetical protein EPO61_01675 [Nitrospirota bacterium]